MKHIKAAASAGAFLLSGVASANFVLDTGTPTSDIGSPVSPLSTAQFLADEFAVTGPELITSVSAYLTLGAGAAGNIGDTFTIDLYSNTSFTGRANQRVLLDTATGTFTGNGWNTTTITNWAPITTAGDYWLALQVSSTTQTKGLDAPGAGISTSSGSAAAVGFAYTGTNGQYVLSSAAPVAMQITGSP